MERSSWKSKTQKAIIAAIVLLVSYFALTDDAGNFSVPGSAELGVQRVGNGFQSMISTVANTTKEKNREMQQVHDDYERRTDKRIESEGGFPSGK